MSATTRHGVRLTLTGAPDADHDIPGLQIPLRPGRTEPLDGDEALERARALIDQGAPIEVVDLDDQLSGDALKQRAAELNIEGRSAMNADQLRAAVATAEADMNNQEGENGA